MTDVLLVCMPFGPVFSPSLGLSLLKAGLARHGVGARVQYFTIPFAERVGQHFYGGVASYGRPPNRRLAGEWIFAHALRGEPAGDPTGYVDDVLLAGATTHAESSDRPVSPALLRQLRRAQAAVDPFLDECVDVVLASGARLVGLTSVFQQHVASLALARRLKAARPELFVVLGGANCEDVMGRATVRQFPFVDAAVSGEADLVFPDLVRRVLDGRPVRGLPGVRTRDELAGAPSSAPMVRHMDELPRPDFSDYFAQYGASRYRDAWQPSLFFETSRGCWWGEKQHCTFCGLNGTTMAYRSKSAARALDELSTLLAAHPGCEVQVTDNILDMRYFEDFIPALAARGLGASLLYETKSNLRKDHLRALAAAGIRRLQPGIESLADDVLQRMKKGVSGLQNVQLLKWCRELGIEPFWNVIWGFPGESPDDYARMAELVPRLVHLPPPGTFGDIRLDRFSPHFVRAAEFGLVDVAPLPPYRHVYPHLAPEAVNDLAYYFSFRYAEPQDVDGYVRPLVRALRRWKKASADVDFFAREVDGRLLLCDTRPGARAAFRLLDAGDARLVREADAVRTTPALASATGRPLADVEQDLRRLESLGVVAGSGARWIALPVAPGPYVPRAAVRERLDRLSHTVRDPGLRDALRSSSVLEGDSDEAPARREEEADS